MSLHGLAPALAELQMGASLSTLELNFSKALLRFQELAWLQDFLKQVSGLRVLRLEFRGNLLSNSEVSEVLGWVAGITQLEELRLGLKEIPKVDQPQPQLFFWQTTSLTHLRL